MPVDEIALNFSPERLRVLNFALALVMFGVALDIRLEDFRRVMTAGRPVVLGLVAQFLLLPALLSCWCGSSTRCPAWRSG